MESEHKKTADWTLKRFGSKESALAYCEGRIDGAEEVNEEFEKNGSTAILADWEDHIQSLADYWKKVKKIIELK